MNNVEEKHKKKKEKKEEKSNEPVEKRNQRSGEEKKRIIKVGILGDEDTSHLSVFATCCWVVHVRVGGRKVKGEKAGDGVSGLYEKCTVRASLCLVSQKTEWEIPT